MKRLLLLGGGHAHVQVLAALAEERLPSATVTLLTPHARALYSGMVPGLVAGHYAEDDCTIPLRPLAGRAGAAWVEAAAEAIDTARRVVRTRDAEFAYDTLSIDTGAVMSRDTIPGAREHGLFVRPIEQFVRLWAGLEALAAQRALSVVVLGGGAAGAELAMAMRHRLGDRARLSLVTGPTPLLPGHPPGVRARALRALKRRAITVLEDRCTAVAADHVLLGSGARLQCDAPVLAIGASAPPWLATSGLALDAQGFVATGPTLQSTSHPEVFAAGDVATRADVAHPRSGVYAVRAGPPLALNLRRFVAGGTLQVYRPQRRSLNLLSCGDRSAIASWGPLAAEGRWVWRWKDRIDRAFIARFATRAP
jgi:selenide,water dikinase